ncbi:MAG: ATP-binding protein [Candidatus Omnitrophica bacterium]|nr:ATP-binding protein [Candidatus Omnitrophota bacterium]
MVTVLFFYGFAFIFMGVILFAIPKNEDFFGILKNFWALAIFGVLHGINEWVDMFILSKWPVDTKMLTIIGAFLLPVSFTFIVIFGILNISQRHPQYRWLRYLPFICLLPWALAYATGKGIVTAGIMARYFICFPGLTLIVIDMSSRMLLYRKELPKVVSLSAAVFILASGIYAVVSGLVVPKADFFPASLINYLNFTRIFGYPVQIIRMFCAVVLVMGAFGMTGIFYKEKAKARLVGGIRRKVLFFTVLFGLVIFASSLLMLYLSGVFTLRKITFNNQQAMVQLMSDSVSEMIESEVKKLESYVESPSIWGAVIADANLKYSTIPVKDRPEYFAKKDREWLQLPAGSPEMNKYINTQLSLRLKKIVDTGNIVEIFFTDRYGGLVVASEKTSDFYQADEGWWQKTFNAGKGNVFIGDMEFDQSSRNWSITISVPVYNKDLELIGVCKAIYNTLKFSEVISKFEIGSTGRAILFDNSGKVICQSGHKLSEINRNQILPEWDVIQEIQAKKVSQSSSHIFHNASGGTLLISWAVVPNKALLLQGVRWIACVEQNAKEVFVGQEFILLLYSIVLFIFLVILSVYFSFLLFRLLIKPIEKMRLGMREIARGNLSYYLNIRSGDELEDLADSFNLMIDTLRKTLVSKDALITEVAERRKVEREYKKILQWQQDVNQLQQLLLSPFPLEKKLKTITDSIVRIFEADFCRIWLIKPGDMCKQGCIHDEVKEEGDVCRYRDKCLHLMASSGRYTHIDGKIHARVPFDCYKIGRIASGRDHSFLTNDVVNDPRVHNHEWARELGLVSFAGYQLRIPGKETIGVLALFAKHPILQDENAMLDNLSSSVAFVVQESISRENIEKQARELNIQLQEREKTQNIMVSMLEDNNIIRDALEKSLRELGQAQEMMVQVAKLGAIGQLASGVAHEVKNPLGIILQGINYLENKIPDKEKDTHEVLEMMKEGIVRADKIINGLLDFSKSAKLELRQEDINSVLENSIDLARVSTKFLGVQIVKEMQKHAPKVRIDKNKMEQVFINILVNAAQAMDNNGKITVRTYLKRLEGIEKSRMNKEVVYFNAGEEAMVVEIEDTGVGIPEENLKKIFDAFFSTKGPKGGAGLGLGVCLSIVDMHKGLIDVESQPGEGTKVTIILKLATGDKDGQEDINN